MKRIFISLLCLLLIGQNLSPVMFAEENPSGMSENGSGMSENDNMSFRGSAATEESGKEGEQLAGNQLDSSALPQNDNNESSRAEQSEGEGSSKGQTGNTQDFYLASGTLSQAPQSHNAPLSPDNGPLMAPEGSKATITLSAEKTNMTYTRQNVFMLNAVFNHYTQDTNLIVHIPSNLVYNSHLISDMEDQNPVENIAIVNKDEGKDIEMKLKDGLAGEFSMSVAISYPQKTSYQGEEATVSADIYRGDEKVDSQTIIFTQVSKGGITFVTPTFTMLPDEDKRNESRIISYVGMGGQSFGYHSDVYLRVPLPDGISVTGDIVCSNCESTSYDPDENVMHIYYPSKLYRGYGHFIDFTLHYDGVATGKFVASEPITAQGMAGGKVFRVYTGSNMTVNVTDEKYSVKISHLYRGGMRNEYLSSNSEEVPLYIFHGIINDGTVDIDDLEIELLPPPEAEIKSVRLPGLVTNAKWGTWEEREVELEYDTNIRTNVITGFIAQGSSVYYPLELEEGEQIIRITIRMQNLKVGEYFSKNTTNDGAQYYYQLTFYGDVSSEHLDGTPMQEGDVLDTQRIIRINGEDFSDIVFQTKWTEIPYFSFSSSTTKRSYPNGIQYNRGDTLIKRIILGNDTYPRGNRGIGENPNLYIKLNNNLQLDTDISHWGLQDGVEITSVVDITPQIYGDIGDAKFYKVSTNMTLNIGSKNAKEIKVPFVVKPDAMPGTYDETYSVYVNFDTGYYNTTTTDNIGLLYPQVKGKVTRITNTNPYFTIIGSSYGMSSRIKSPLDPNRKAGYDDTDDSSLSIITDNTSSTYRQIFYNESSEDMNNLEITIPLPQKDDENGSQWRGILSGEVTAKVLQEEEMNDLDGVDITYSSDGINYLPYTYFTNSSQIKKIKLHIATRPAKSQVVVDADILVTGNPSDGQIAKITSEWTFGGQNFGSQIQAMVYHPAPKATITYSPSTPTTGGVVATISFDQANVEITNNSGSVDYLFTQTGEFLYEWRSMRNITGTTLAMVAWIIPEPTTPTLTKHTVTFVDDDGTTVLRPATEYDYGTPASDIIRPADPTKKGYKFTGWTPSITDVTGDVVYKATYKKVGGGGGRSGAEHPDPECEGDCECKGDCDDPNPEHGSPEEERDMHKWAYDNGLTIYKPGEDAKFDQPLTRQQMAKISSIFGAKFIGQKADDSEGKVYECSQYKDLDKSKGEMRGYVIQSCLMKNMGYEYDNIRYIPKFKPYNKLTLAQASIIISRMAWGDKYVISPKKWYQGHMYAAYDHGLIDDISDPHREISRREAFLMLYRLSLLMNSDK